MSARGRWLALSLLFAVSFVGLGRDLWTPDEPREAGISREMLLSPAVVPSLNGEEFIEKPPLYYWTVASVFALLGEPSAAAARGVSGTAAFLTLLLIYFWGRHEFSACVGLVAAIGLATSTQFMITSHWVGIDPLLMLFTTAAAWAGSELTRGRGGAKTLIAFYAALVLALWTKGLIGPLLIASGLLVYAATRRSIAPLLRLRPFAGIALMSLGTAAIAALIYADSGTAAVREWLWVNHVQRFLDPDYTGHEQPFYYYFWALPMAVFPWWAPLAAVFRRSGWRRSLGRDHDAKLYCGALSLGMVLLLSASATKRGLYLLPALPPLFLLLAVQAVDWWEKLPTGPLRGRAWWLQVGCVALFASAPTALALGYLRTVELPAAAYLTLPATLIAALIVFARRGHKAKAIGALAVCAVAGTFGLFVVVTHLAAPQKDMTPFLSCVDEQLPPGRPVYVTGDVDETLRGIVPFVTGREVVQTARPEVSELRPLWILVQDKNGGNAVPELGTPYRLARDRHFGPRRYMALWQREHDETTWSPTCEL